jgi:hypothetical protein
MQDEMKMHNPDGFSICEPAASKKVHWVVLVLFWGVQDVWAGKWLGLWAVPNNRLKLAITYLYLSLVAKLGGGSSRVPVEEIRAISNDFDARNATTKYD